MLVAMSDDTAPRPRRRRRHAAARARRVTLAASVGGFAVLTGGLAATPATTGTTTVAVAWGVVGLYLLLAVELTSLARSRLPRKVWRMTHAASFPLFVVATVHLLTAGTDAGALLTRALVTAVVATVAGLTAYRVIPLGSTRRVPSRRVDVDAQARQAE